jgi:RNA methyltransferase, TrmH family
VRTALDAGCVAEALFVDAQGGGAPDVSTVVAAAGALGTRLFTLAPGVMARVADTVTPQPVLATFPMPESDPAALQHGTLVLVLAGVRDPGNAGTLLRTAEAAGADAVVFCGSSVDPYNPKTVRSSAGSIFLVPVVVMESARDALDALGAQGYRRVGAVVRGGEDYVKHDWKQRTAIVVGNEAAGLPAELPLDVNVAIPMSGRAESLNVGVAGALLCFEALRQRRAGSS